jgi:hypothetical protein
MCQKPNVLTYLDIKGFAKYSRKPKGYHLLATYIYRRRGPTENKFNAGIFAPFSSLEWFMTCSPAENKRYRSTTKLDADRSRGKRGMPFTYSRKLCGLVAGLRKPGIDVSDAL